MKHTLRAEWIKLRTVPVHWVLAIIAFAFPVVVTTLVASFVDGPFTSDDLAGLITGLSIVSAMLLGALSVISLTSEYSHNTIRPTYAATPHRLRVILSKMVTNSVVIGLLTTVIVFLAWLVASPILSARDRPVSIGDDQVLASLFSMIVLSVVVSWFGFGLGLLIRNSPATVTIFLLWPLLIENLIGLVLTLMGGDGATKWLPYAAGITATVAEDEPDVLGRPWGLVYFGAIALALVVMGTVLDERRDA